MNGVKNGMAGVHLPNSENKKDQWLTPPEILKNLGSFDLDPCAPIPSERPWEIANTHFDKRDCGLVKDWFGRVWLNPPYGRETKKWIKKLSEHGNGIALIFARTETDIFFPYVWDMAHSILFLRKRLNFYDSDGNKAPNNSGAPSCLVAYGRNNTDWLKKSDLLGKLIILNDSY